MLKWLYKYLDLFVMMKKDKSRRSDPNIEIAHITSRRALIGIISAAIVGLIGVISAAVINTCHTSVPSPGQIFSGRVYNKNNPSENIGNAKVIIEGEGTPLLVTTDSEGVFSFVIVNPNKEIRLRIEAKGFVPYDLRATPIKQTGIQYIALIPQTDTSVELSGSVVDVNGKPIQGAEVTIDDIKEIQPAETSSDGIFTLKNIPKKYGEGVRIKVVKEGYLPNPYTEDVMIGRAPPPIELRKVK